ncbi:pyroglutamyl-peptidase I [Frondihabitans cladoniiphilus]|uniref:Pyroglutamyl-peptidase I n=1 Tax=Frondihabitans cladoniiphilus TaxID=715785 RepID=A0ABP8VZY0_9MICO
MTTILLTGFEPFAGAESNPSGQAVELVASRWNRPETLVTSILPVEFDAAGAALATLVADHSPDVVLAAGLADGRRSISIERVAINVDDARIPDNGGAQPIDRPIDPSGPAAWFATLPIKAITAAVGREGIPVAVSQTAGTYVCNHVFYETMRLLAAVASQGPESGGCPGRPPARGGFVHVPAADVVSVEQSACALEIALATTLAVGAGADAVVSAGAEH